MTSVFDRRIEHFQHKVQVNINLADDEIGRLSNDLTEIQGEINQTKDQLNRVNIILSQSEQAKLGKTSRDIAKKKAKIAKIKTQHENEILELVEKHRKEMETLQHDYQESLSRLEVWAQKREAQRTGNIDLAIKQAQEMSQQLLSTVGRAEKAAIEDASPDVEELNEIEYARLTRLETAVRQKNDERYAALMAAKSRLSDCVTTLEEMERNQILKINSLQNKLKALDASYQMRQKRCVDQNTHAIDTLKRKLEEAKKKEEMMRESIDKVEHIQKRQIYSTVREGEELRLTMQAVNSEPRREASKDGDENSFAEYEKLKKILEAKENELINARTENESMKRELGRLKHESKMKNLRKNNANF